MNDYIKAIRIDKRSSIPFYMQLIDALLRGVEAGFIAVDEPLPSLHHFSVELDISKNSVEKAYNILKNRGLVIATKGKGYFLLV